MIWTIQVSINLSLLKLTITWQLYTRLVQFYQNIFLHSRKCYTFSRHDSGKQILNKCENFNLNDIFFQQNHYERGLFNNSDMPFFVEYLSTGKSPLEICSGIIERIRFILTHAIREQVGWIKANLVCYELWKLTW